MSDSIREPLAFDPVIQDKLWGGDGLWRFLKKGAPDQVAAGESWEISDRPEAPTRISKGRFAGQSFAPFFQKYRQAILGKHANQGAADGSLFPLLYKFIYAREALSVQVHPGTGSPLGEAKTECWYIVAAPENAELIVGVSQDLPREAMKERLASPRCQEVLRRESVQAGDLIFIPAGTVHAITEGLLIYELQQNSDTTFRLHDWNRLDASGKPRALHVEPAAQVMDLRVHHKHKIKPLVLSEEPCRIEVRVACPFFSLWEYSDFQKPVTLTKPEVMRVMSVVGGQFALEWPGHTLSLGLGETALLPADLPEVVLAPLSKDSRCLISGIADLDAEIATPLLKRGNLMPTVHALGGLDGWSLR
jgi:mannose-6-phosphate isomerase